MASKPYYMKRDLQEGEHDLLKLVDTEKFEGAWVFNLLTSEWYYTVAEFFNKENIDTPEWHASIYDLDYSSIGSRVSLYHTHTKHSELFVYEQLLDGIKDERLGNKMDQVTQILGIWAAQNIVIPSVGDVKSFIELVQNNSEVDFGFRIANPYGILSLKFGQNVDSLIQEKYIQVRKTVLLKPKVYDTKIDAIDAVLEAINRGMAGAFQVQIAYK